MDKEEETLIGICPSCGKPFKIESKGGEEESYCSEICSNPAAIPKGVRLLPDQARLIFTDTDMHEYTREEYIKNHGIDPLPIWRAIEKLHGQPTEGK